MKRKYRFLFVGPHPDDVELGIAGTIIKLADKGNDIFIVDLTDGEPTPYGDRIKRKKETLRATRILGVRKRINLGLENRYLIDTKEARLQLAEQIRIFRPDIIFAPYYIDAHPDHIAASSIVVSARFYAKYSKIEMKGEPYYTPFLLYYFCTHLKKILQPSFLVDISLQFSRKMKAIKCYRSQFIDNSNNRIVTEYVKTINRYLGMLIYKAYAEPLYSEEVISDELLKFFL